MGSVDYKCRISYNQNVSEINGKNTVYIATSLDGYIADRDGKLDWLESIPNPDGNDFGYSDFMENIDALVMGRNTYEVVLGFDIPWPYTKPVFVLSNFLESIPDELQEKVQRTFEHSGSDFERHRRHAIACRRPDGMFR